MKQNKNYGIQTFFISIIGIVVVLYILKTLQHIFLPLIIAYFFVLVFMPINRFLSSKKIPISIATIFNLSIISVLIWGLISIIISSAAQFAEALPIYEKKFALVFAQYGKVLNIKEGEVSGYIFNRDNISQIFGGVFSSTMSFISALFLILFYFIFLNTGYDRVLEVVKEKYSGLDDSRLEKRIKDIPAKIQSYIITKIFISLLTAMIIGIILYVFDVDFIVIWIVLTFLLNFIPNFGSIIAVILPMLTLFLQFNSISKAVLFAVFASVIQNIIGNYVEPKIMGNKLGLNPLFILFSLLIWGYIWGLAGMFLAIPIMAVIKILITDSDSETLTFISKLIS